MTSNYRAHQRWAISRTIRTISRDAWCDFTWLLKRMSLKHFKPNHWKWVYECELYDIQYEAHEAEVQEARERIMADEWQSLHDKF